MTGAAVNDILAAADVRREVATHTECKSLG
jgi:hypothetical protein